MLQFSCQISRRGIAHFVKMFKVYVRVKDSPCIFSDIKQLICCLIIMLLHFGFLKFTIRNCTFFYIQNSPSFPHCSHQYEHFSNNEEDSILIMELCIRNHKNFISTSRTSSCTLTYPVFIKFFCPPESSRCTERGLKEHNPTRNE